MNEIGCIECGKPECPGITACPRCGSGEHGSEAATQVADHGMCRDCQHSSRPHHYMLYSGIPEVAPGVFVDPGESVTIVDDEGEVATWTADEVAEDDDAFTAAVNAAVLAALKGAAAVRENIETRGEVLVRHIEEVASKIA